MSHTPEADEDDDLDTVPPPPPVFHVEQALLGALLLDPHRLGGITAITADSFSTAAHAALFTAISTLPAPDPAEHATSATWLDQVLTAALDHARGLTAPYLHTLIQNCPWPRHAPAYARMVEAEHARRHLRTAAEHLIQTVHDTSLPHPVRAVLAETDTLTAIVDDIASRFPPRSGVLPRTPPPLPATAPDHAEAVQEEQMLLATAAARPADIESVRWLTAQDFIEPLHAGLWQCLCAMARRHEPIDPVTVLWEAQQRSLLDHASKPGEVLHLLSEPAESVEQWGKRILHRSLLTTADHAGRRIQAYTDDPATTPFQLVVGARRALADIGAVRTRWQHATATVPPPQPRQAPPTRAGPPATATAHLSRVTRVSR
ncbi:DnaB-like helicase N-terminal domain-containing protein [Streptomyces antibioticus]|uniref:DnaB-like helicase N-terminal domain-containing protein n=1 Tax=Streptomyces antibioticus TaxID=1890 RepID=UPI0036FB0AB8